MICKKGKLKANNINQNKATNTLNTRITKTLNTCSFTFRLAPQRFYLTDNE